MVTYIIITDTHVARRCKTIIIVFERFLLIMYILVINLYFIQSIQVFQALYCRIKNCTTYCFILNNSFNATSETSESRTCFSCQLYVIELKQTVCQNNNYHIGIRLNFKNSKHRPSGSTLNMGEMPDHQTTDDRLVIGPLTRETQNSDFWKVYTLYALKFCNTLSKV